MNKKKAQWYSSITIPKPVCVRGVRVSWVFSSLSPVYFRLHDCQLKKKEEGVLAKEDTNWFSYMMQHS